MTVRTIVQFPDPVFKRIADPVTVVNDDVRALVQDLLDTLAYERAVGLAAPMIGVSQRVIVLDLAENDVSQPRIFINPEITWVSDERASHEEASLSLRGISAEVERPNALQLTYLDLQGNLNDVRAEGFLATVIQHEMDYLDGKTYLDKLSRMKREMLIKKMDKYNKMHPPHVHGPGCQH